MAEEARKRNVRRFYASVGVAVLHVLIVILLVTSEWVPIELPIKKIEPMQWIVLNVPGRAAQVKPVKAHSDDVGTFNPNVVPRLPKPKEQSEESNAITDLGWALGRSLACGANSYEWLNNKMRAECMRKPWNFAYDRYGNIVLDTRARIERDEETLRPSDVQTQERNTAPACPQNVDPNAPCLSAIIHGHR